MPTYDYKCRNEECESVVREDPDHVTRRCSIADSKILPKCMYCGQEMPKAFLEMAQVQWKGYDPNGKPKIYGMGPSKRADRRHAGWDHKTGEKVLQPVYRGKGSVSKDERREAGYGRSEGDCWRAEDGDSSGGGREAGGSQD